MEKTYNFKKGSVDDLRWLIAHVSIEYLSPSPQPLLKIDIVKKILQVGEYAFFKELSNHYVGAINPSPDHLFSRPPQGPYKFAKFVLSYFNLKKEMEES